MKKILALLVMLLTSAALFAQNMSPTTPHLQGSVLHGQSRLRVMVHVYDAGLYVPANFNAAQLFSTPLALTIVAGRSFRSESIVRQMVKELKRQSLKDTALADYEKALSAVMPSVEEDDVLTGVYTPAQGWALWFKNKQIGRWNDDAFGQAFFNIWLGANTSQPTIRSELLKRQ